MTNVDPTSWQSRISEIHRAFDEGQISLARESAKQLSKDLPNVVEVQFTCAGFLIDCGTQLADVEAIREGISILEIRCKASPGREATLGQGYLAMADLEVGADLNPWALANCAAFQQGKRHLLDVATGQPTATPSAGVWLAAGHAMSKVGREIEAYYFYEQAQQIGQDAPLALGAKANSLIFLSPILGLSKRSALEEAGRLLKQAIESPRLDRDGYPGARENFQGALDRVHGFLKELSVESVPELGMAPDPETAPPHLKEFLVYCRRWRLFLSYHLHDERVLPALGDTVFPSTFAAEGAEERFCRVATLFNQLKEDFATARYLLYMALHPDERQRAVALMTGYVELGDGSLCWLDNGLLKSMFTLTYNALDKIGFFANEWLGLGHRERDVTFLNFWRQSLSRGKAEAEPGLHSRLADMSNPSIVGLVDLSRDLSSDAFENLRKIRHAQTHRSLVLVRRDATYEARIRGVVCVHRWRLEWEAVRLLRTVKSAIFALAAAVEVEEHRKLGPGRHTVCKRHISVQTEGEAPDRKYWGM